MASQRRGRKQKENLRRQEPVRGPATGAVRVTGMFRFLSNARLRSWKVEQSGETPERALLFTSLPELKLHRSFKRKELARRLAKIPRSAAAP